MRIPVGRVALVLLIATAPLEARAQTGRVVGTVRAPDGSPVEGTLVTLATDRLIANTRTDAAGSFEFTRVTEGRHELRVTFPGFSPWVQLIEVLDGQTVSVDVSLRLSVQRLDSVLVTAVRTGVFGVIGDIRNLAPLDSAVVQVVGFRGADTSSDGGRFNLDRVAGGRSYVVRITRRGYETRSVAISTPNKGGFELIAFLEPGLDRRTNDEALWREFDNRLHYGGANAALITRSELGGVARSNLMSSLTHARPLLAKSLRLHPSALSDPMSPAYPCIFVNGRLAPRSTLLDYFSVGEIEAIEAYGFGTLQHERLAGKLSAIPPGRIPCGVAPTRWQTFEGTAMKTPAIRESTARGMIAVVVIWLRQ